MISDTIRDTVDQFPVVFLTGPRQSGKTTLLKHEFPSFRYVNLEDPEERIWANEQPRDFLHNHKWPLVIDEAQYAPEWYLPCQQKPVFYTTLVNRGYLTLPPVIL